MLSLGRTQSVFMDAKLVTKPQVGTLPGGRQIVDLTYDLTIPGTDLDGGRLQLRYLAYPSDTHTLGDQAHLTLSFAEPKPVLIPTGKLHVGFGPDKALCRVYPDAEEFTTTIRTYCPHCQLLLTR